MRPSFRHALFIGIAVVLAGLARGASAAPSVDWTRVTPDVVRFDRTAPVTIAAKISGDVPTQVQFANADGTFLTMRDDGVGPDAVANDRIYTTAITAAQAVGDLQPSEVFRKFVGFVDVYQGSTRVTRVFVQTQVWTPAIGEVDIVSLGAQIQHSNYAVNIVDLPTFAAGPLGDFRPLARRFYQSFPDAFDFIDVVFETSHVANRYHLGVRNPVSGIGGSLYNNAFDYGSAGRLLGMNIYPIGSYFDAGQETHSHEVGHQWINFVPQQTLTTGSPHWPLSSLASGIMGFSIPGNSAGGDYNCKLTAIPTGVQLTPFSGARVYSDLDLYLMGLKPAGEVADIYVWNNQQAAQNQNCQGVIGYSQFTKVTMSQIIAAAGPRVPAYPNTQRDFKVAVIVLSDTKLSPEAMAFYDYFAQRAEVRSTLSVHQGFFVGTGNPFYVATGGAGTMTARVRDGVGAGTYVTVYEFHAPSLDHYFRTAEQAEADSLKSNPALGWQATGNDFKAYARNDHPSTAQPVCRFYGSVTPGPNSHFFTAHAAECEGLKQLQQQIPASQPRWNFEEIAFAIDVPVNGNCPPSAPVPVYRAYNNRAAQNDSNHRHTTIVSEYQVLVAQGWIGEGVTMCAPLVQ